jgi:hypothetical protein
MEELRAQASGARHATSRLGKAEAGRLRLCAYSVQMVMSSFANDGIAQLRLGRNLLHLLPHGALLCHKDA